MEEVIRRVTNPIKVVDVGWLYSSGRLWKPCVAHLKGDILSSKHSCACYDTTVEAELAFLGRCCGDEDRVLAERLGRAWKIMSEAQVIGQPLSKADYMRVE